jgi:hypothetical protein
MLAETNRTASLRGLDEVADRPNHGLAPVATKVSFAEANSKVMALSRLT